MTDSDKLEELEKFLKEAFCIDGACTFHKHTKVDDMGSLMFKLTDTRRGTFYVTITK